MTITPVSLLERLRRKTHREAWDRFVVLYAPLIYVWGRRAGLQDQDAEDLVQEVLITLVQVLPDFSYDRHRSFRRWLRTVTLNKWRDRRKQRSAQPVPGSPSGLAELVDPAEPDDFWESEFRRQLVERALRVMQADFQPTTWRACWEHVVCARPAAEVAAELGLTRGAVYAARFRVLDRLRQELAGMLD
jgi:RNA polymerase sigma-70 factor (ECF subfamily)